jgi:hypothetical protein
LAWIFIGGIWEYESHRGLSSVLHADRIGVLLICEWEVEGGSGVSEFGVSVWWIVGLLVGGFEFRINVGSTSDGSGVVEKGWRKLFAGEGFASGGINSNMCFGGVFLFC